MTTKLSAFTELKLFVGFAANLRGFLRKPMTPDECAQRMLHGLQTREESFLDILENGIYAIDNSPYRKLLVHAGITIDDVKHSVRNSGLEKTLEWLLNSGVYLTLNEFKGRRPIRRGNLELDVNPRDFDNPLIAGQIVSQTSGSRSGTRISMDLAHYEQDAAYVYYLDLNFGLLDRPFALWRPLPPFIAGVKDAITRCKLRLNVQHWFSQNKYGIFSQPVKHYLMTALMVHVSRLIGRPMPAPEHVPPRDVWRIAEWLASYTANGNPAYLHTNVASAIRIVQAAQERELDISGTFFRVGGEPLTVTRAAIFRAAGCEVACHYAMGEQGLLGIGCASPNAVDDVHMLLDKVAVIQREISLAPDFSVLGNLYTTLIRTPPKLMLNVESDDYGSLEHRACSCKLGEIGYSLHFHTIQSYEKLTSEGMNFLGSDLLKLLEDILPNKFGGNLMDYQFLETEEQGLPKVSLVISPRVGDIDETSVVACVIDFLNQCSGGNQYGERWRESNTLRVLRQDPSATGTSKVHALHVERQVSEVES